ncbi:MAG: segregation/condensation protein A [Planctomycetes bacterium]|nr:segregation/condensation protein A [Planctomycetota bacterium]
MADFRVQLEIFRGPLDLLLYLVRKHEVEIVDIPIALITDQFLEHMAVLEQIDMNAVGDFLDMASTLIEIKSRMVLPRGGEEEEPLEDPRQDLVERLLQYKRFRDAASLLEEQSRQWQQRYTRCADDTPRELDALAEQPIHEVELWDLVSAFGRILRDRQAQTPSNIVYDDTPIHVYMQRIHDDLVEKGRVPLTSMFQPGMHRSSLVGIFLAVLELVRHYQVRSEQNDLFGEIWILPPPGGASQINIAAGDEYEHGAANGEEGAS